MGLGFSHGIHKHVGIEDEEEEWDDYQRYRDNKVKIGHSKFCLYHRSGSRDQ
jgi:hypothetical protein